MDLKDVFKDPRAKAKRAEALGVIHKGIQGAAHDWEMSSGLLISRPAALAYDEAKRVATRLLFEEYAKIAFEREIDAEVFIGFLPEIQRQVDVDLQAEYDGENPEHKGKRIARIDFQEAKSCQFEWEKTAWERPKPTIPHKLTIIQRFRQFIRRDPGVATLNSPQSARAQTVVEERVSVDTARPAEVSAEPDLAAVESSVKATLKATDPDQELVKRVVGEVGIESFLAQFPHLKRTPLTDYMAGRISGRVSKAKREEIIVAARKYSADIGLGASPDSTRTEGSD